MTTSGLRLEVSDGVGTLTFDRPEALNALDLATKTALLAGLGELAADEGVRCVVLTGTGRAFCVGQDLREHVAGLTAGTPEDVWRTVPEHYNPIALALHTLDKPVVAAVNGVAAGAGASLAFLADLRVVAASASFTLAFAGVGLSADTGASWTLPRLVGPTRALDLLYSGRRVGAEEALAIGLATEVVADEDFAEHVQQLAARLAAGPTLAFGTMRRAVAAAAGQPLAAALETEAEGMRRTGASADHRAAVEAFLARRPASFSGR
ncbi:Enoyl-CoA hydratase [Friedmanniella luteola]|uniref:Enoyl-CoA hydratase n=1 Tax=Friedmanniella luteola TaxID=546871 RepID=A0A1H1NHN4_9ACTN|nr:enoyl-CoA hydratase-related protein [Friedmanniella luteola]SDR98506.1 Enoyl-CoA hydratase [Friedmanniella luteola]